MKWILYIFVSLFIFSELWADNTFPYSLSAKGDYPNGSLLCSDSSCIYFIKNHILGEADFIYNWKDLNKKSSKAFSVNNSQIFAKAVLDRKLFLIIKEFSEVKAVIFDSSGQKISEKVLLKSYNYNDISVNILEIRHKRILANINSELFDFILKDNEIKFSKYPIDAIDAVIIKSNEQEKIIAASNSQTGIIITSLQDSSSAFIAKLPAYESVSLAYDSKYLFAVSGAKYSKNTLCQIIDIKKGIVDEFWIDAGFNNTLLIEDTDHPILSYLGNQNNQYTFTVFNPYTKKEIYSVVVKENFIEPYGIYYAGGEIAAVFRNGIAVFNKSGKKLASDYFAFGEYVQGSFSVNTYNDNIIISSDNYSLAFEKTYHPLWYINTIINESAEILIPMILFGFLIIFIQLYRHQKRFLNTLLDLSSYGAVFILKKNGKLIRYNKAAMIILGITDSVPKRKNFQYYCIKPATYHLRDLAANALTNKETITQKVMMTNGSETKEWLFSILPMRNIAGRFRGIIITGIDITAELEKKRLNNWAQLAHDMQTNLSTIKLNAEQLNLMLEDENYSRKEKIIHQVNILIQRVRDIVTVGRNNSIDKQYYDSAEILKEVREEFDTVLFPNVNFIVEASSFKVYLDKPKMLRAVRNAIENGIRSLPDKSGTIRLSNTVDARNAYFKISDSGSGMDLKTKEKMLTPYFTTGSKEGGSGIGTMIMQHVMELHGGEIKINSERGKGTEIIFSVPNYSSASAKQKNQNKLFVRKKVT